MRIEAIETYLMRAEGAGGLHSAAYPESAAPLTADASGLSSEGSRHWLFVRIHCENGLTGIGEASGWPLAQESALRVARNRNRQCCSENCDRGDDRNWCRLHVAP